VLIGGAVLALLIVVVAINQPVEQETTSADIADELPRAPTTTAERISKPTTTTSEATITTVPAPTTTVPPTTLAPATTLAVVTTTAPPPTTTIPKPTTTAAPRTTTTVAAASSSSGCHSSYRGTCVPPNVSDADCYPGKGDGPHYVHENNIEVVGPDEFGLDSDKDGIGCES
jgi:hypothetical protein